MTDQIDDTEIELSPEEENLAALKRKADLLGIKYGPRVGVDTLLAKIKAKMEDEDEPEEEAVAAPVAKKSKAQLENELREEIRLKAHALVRVRITNMNPNKRDMPGEFISVGNDLIGVITKYIPFGSETDEGYHVPRILLNVLRERTFAQTKVDETNPAKPIISTRMVPEFAIQELEPLTAAEIERLRVAQAVAAGDVN